MESINLDSVLKNIYTLQVLEMKKRSIIFEKEYFSKNGNIIPTNELKEGISYDEYFSCFKYLVKHKPEVRNQVFTLLQKVFLFSAGHDMMFKKKLKADMFMTVPMEEFIYPKLSEAAKEKYNDMSVMEGNPNLASNMEGLNKLVFTYLGTQSLLYFLYLNDFQFPKGWKKFYPEIHEEILNILNNSKITIGEFLHALIDSKCKIMIEIFSEIHDSESREIYLEKIKALKEKKHKETNNFAHVNLPVTYFLNNPLTDFMNFTFEIPIFEKDTSISPKMNLSKKDD